MTETAKPIRPTRFFRYLLIAEAIVIGLPVIWSLGSLAIVLSAYAFVSLAASIAGLAGSVATWSMAETDTAAFYIAVSCVFIALCGLSLLLIGWIVRQVVRYYRGKVTHRNNRRAIEIVMIALLIPFASIVLLAIVAITSS